MNQKTNDNKCFQHAVTLALNIDKINDHPERISKIEPFIEKYNWKDIDFPSTSKDWKKFELNNEVALNILYVPHGTKKIEIAYKSKHNLTREKQVILSMISNGENWHYLIVKNLSRLLRGITSNHDGDFYCLNCFHPTEQKINLMHTEKYAKKNKLNYYRGEDCMKRICKDLREHATKIIDCEKKDMLPLTKEEEENYNNQEVCYICKKEFITSDNKHYKVRDHCQYTGKYRGAAHNICNLRYKIPKDIPIIFHNGSTYDYHFIIRELVKEFQDNFECLGENTEKYITFSVPIKKRIENKDIEITYKIKFIDSFRFMATSLSKLVDNLMEGIHSDKCINCKSDISYMKVMDETLIFRCFNCKRNYKKEINKELI